MPRCLPPGRLVGLLALAALAVATVAAPARAAGAWTSYLRMESCSDMLAFADTVWLASGEAGVVRYLRSAGGWDSFTHEPGGLAGNATGPLAFDRSGNLWVGVQGRGLSRLAPDRTHWVLFNGFDGLPSDTITVLRPQGDTLWIGTAHGLALWDGHEIAGSVPDVGQPPPFANPTITGIVVYGDTLFVSTPAGIYLSRISRQLQGWTVADSGLIGPNVFGLAYDGRTLMALSTKPNVIGTLTWDNAAGVWRAAFGNADVQRIRDDNGHILSISSQGTYAWTGSGWTLLPGSPTTLPNVVGGGVEIGADPAGKAFAFRDDQLFEQAGGAFTAHVTPGPPENDFFNVAVRGQDVYVATRKVGFGRLRNGVWRNYTPGTGCGAGCDTSFDDPAFPFAMLVDPEGPMWVACWSAAITRFDDRVDPPTFQNLRYADTFDADHHTWGWSAAVDSNANVRARGRWFGMDTPLLGSPGFDPIGIDVYDENGNHLRSLQPGYPGLLVGQIRALAVDKDNQMWVGYAQQGFSVFQVPAAVDTGAITLTTVATGLDVFGIVPYGDTLWVMASDALHRFDRRSRRELARYDLAGQPADIGAVHPLAVGPDGTAYVGTTGGLQVFQPGRAPVTFTPDNSPIAGIEVRCEFVQPDGVVWIGTSTGLNRYDPDFVPPPPPRLSSLTLRPYPNPLIRTGVGFQLHLAGNASSYAGEVYDLNGRVVQRFTADANGRIVWDGRDRNGAWVPAGVYFLHARGDGAEGTARVVVMR